MIRRVISYLFCYILLEKQVIGPGPEIKQSTGLPTTNYIIHNHQKLEMTQMPLKMWMDKQTKIHPCYEMDAVMQMNKLLIYTRLDPSQTIYAKW